MFEFCSISAGGSIDAAQQLTSGAADIAVNWAGGLHHAKRREASGFCYINDIVLGILELLRTYPRVLYIDIDCHHGDGVEEAFYTTDRVMTASFHKFGEYFPGTGTQEDRGRGKGKGYSVNVPLKDGITDSAYQSVFEPVIAKIMAVYRPSAVVLQCGADSLAGDKLGGFNLTMHGHAHCVQFLRSFNVPLILLGGGGYTIKNVARAWTYETACALGIENEINPHLPWNGYFEWFGPRYRLEVVENSMEDVNVKDSSLDVVRCVFLCSLFLDLEVDKDRNTALEQLDQIQHAPSVQMMDVPGEDLGTHLGFKRDTGESRDQSDQRLARTSSPFPPFPQLTSLSLLEFTRYLYQLQDSSDSSGSDSEDNAETDAPIRRKRMSIITNKYFDLPAVNEGVEDPCGVLPSKVGGKGRRRFFDSTKWDENGGVDGAVRRALNGGNGASWREEDEMSVD